MQSECSVLFGDCPPVWGTDNLGDISLSSLRLVNALTATPSSSSRANCEIFPFPVAAYALPCSFVDQFVATDHLLRFLLRCPRHILYRSSVRFPHTSTYEKWKFRIIIVIMLMSDCLARNFPISINGFNFTIFFFMPLSLAHSYHASICFS